MSSAIRFFSVLAITTAASTVNASPTTFPGETSFRFLGTMSSSGPLVSACALGSSICFTSFGDSLGARVVGRTMDQLQTGSAIRADIANQDPDGSAIYHSMELDLETRDFFTQNPGAHLVFAPRTLLPLQINGVQYNNYPAFPRDPATQTKVPYAYGDGVIIGNVPCNSSPGVGYASAGTNLSSGIAQEIFLRPDLGTQNFTACAQEQLSFLDNSTYRVKILVKQDQCPPGRNATCRWIGYRIQKLVTGPVFGPQPPQPSVKGGLDTRTTEFRDETSPAAVFGGGPTVLPAGWTTLQPADRSAWFIGHAFTSATSASWSFQVNNVQVTASNTLPTWWNAASL
jgi:hypothetical protein